MDGSPSRTDELRFPKSLYLIQPLFSPYELNAVGATAQASVVPPDGLDLNAWFVEPPSVVIPDIPADDAEVGKMKKSKKEKVRDLGSNASLSGKKASKRNGGGALNNIMASNVETAEEITQREKVGNQTSWLS